MQNCQNQFGEKIAFEKPQIISRSHIQIGNGEKLALETYRVISWRVGFPCVTGLLVKFQWLACAELSTLYHTSDCWVYETPSVVALFVSCCPIDGGSSAAASSTTDAAKALRATWRTHALSKENQYWEGCVSSCPTLR